MSGAAGQGTRMRRRLLRLATGLILRLPPALQPAGIHAYHWLTFVARHRRWPRKPASGFNNYLYALKTGGALAHALRRRVTDKALGKRYIDRLLGRGHTVPTLAVLDSPEAIAAFSPAAFPVVLKPTHSSGRLVICQDAGALQAAQPLLLGWLVHDYYRETLESNYAGLARRVIAEPYIDKAFYLEGSIHCRNGRARIISVIDRFDVQKRRASLTSDWRHLHVALGQPYQALDMAQPAYLGALLEAAETVSAAFDYIRVDFYASDSGFLLGELTNLPGGALARFSSRDGEHRFNRAFLA
ncbi:MAG TPA: ATP-grasp fold amidoligase family protein [Burkholderiaceae bacterium]